MTIIRPLILKFIRLSNGIKDTNLVMQVMNEINPQRFDKTAYYQEIKELVDESKIIELQYEYYDEVRSIYFLPETTMTITTPEPRTDIDGTSDSTDVAGKSDTDK